MTSQPEAKRWRASAQSSSMMGYLALAFLMGCGGIESSTQDKMEPEHSETQLPSESCPVIDATEPEVARVLAESKVVTQGEPTVRYEAGRRISSIHLKVLRSNEADSSGSDRTALLLDTVKVTCTSSCNGNWCRGSGCDASSWGCSTYTCTTGCTGSCTKTSTYIPKEE